jgi:indole-3-glycerol phosphate synthase
VRSQKETHGHDARATMLVAESGIHTRADVERLAKCGAGAILVGESLVKGGDIRAKVKELLRG